MAIYPNGAPYVPESCPQSIEGPPILDLTKADFHLAVHYTSNRPEPVVETYGAFIVGDPEGDEPHSRVETELITKLSTSLLGQHLLRFAGIEEGTAASIIIHPAGSMQAERARQLFCDRVATCDSFSKGECWALGDTATREILAKVLYPDNESSPKRQP
jgi:hypothetical protein